MGDSKDVSTALNVWGETGGVTLVFKLPEDKGSSYSHNFSISLLRE